MRYNIDLNNSEIKALLESKQPSLELCLIKGHIAKRSFFSKLFYKIGFDNKESDRSLKIKIGHIIENLIDGDDKNQPRSAPKSLLNRAFPAADPDLLLEIFLEKLNLMKDSQLPKNAVQSLEELKIVKSKSYKNSIKDLHLRVMQRLQIDNSIEELPVSDDWKLEFEQITGKAVPERIESNRKLVHFLKAELLEAKLSSKIAKMQYLYRLGNLGGSSKGVTGTKLIFDKKNGNGTSEVRLLGVFKPDIRYAPLSCRIANFFRKLFGQLSFLSQKPFSQSKAEYGAYLASTFFSIDGVPPSRQVYVGGERGVFQLAVQSAIKSEKGEMVSSSAISRRIKEAEELKKILNKGSRLFSEEELNHFQRFALLDFFIGNLDAHGENWFVEINSKEEICNIIAIDKANSFPRFTPPRGHLASANQFQWKKWAIAEKAPFTDELRTLMRGFDRAHIDEFIALISHELGDFLDPQMIDLLYKRGELIAELADKENSTPSDLANSLYR